MSLESDEDRNAQLRRPKLQFSVRALLGLTVCVAVACSVLFAMPDQASVAVIVVISVLLPALLTTGAIHGGTYQRTFCIGALFPTAFMLLTFTLFSYYWLPMVLGRNIVPLGGPEQEANLAFWFRVHAGASWAMSIIVGLLCLALRRLTEKGGKTGPQS